MKYLESTQKTISSEVEKLISFIEFKTINEGISKKSKEQRISQEIETYTNKTILSAFKTNKSNFEYLKEIEKNNGSSKAKYELLFKFVINEIKHDIYVDLKPINSISKGSSPFMGSISKYIDRISNNHFYDLYLIVNYEANVDVLPKLLSIDKYFVKDIENFTLYNNWQLQINIKKIKHTDFTKPEVFKKKLISLLVKMKDNTVIKIQKKCEDFISKIQ